MLGSAKRLRVVHVLAPAQFGGLESVVRRLAVAQRAWGHDVRVLLVTADGGELPPLGVALREAGVGVIHAGVPPRRYGVERAAVRDALRQSPADIVHTHGYRPDVVDGAVARSAGAAVVSTIHGFIGGTLTDRIYQRLQARALRRYDAVIAVSQPLVRVLEARGIQRSRIHLLPNGYADDAPAMTRSAARAQLGIDRVGFVAGWVGRLSSEKGADVFIDALAKIADHSVHGVIVGAGPERNVLEARGRTTGIADRLRFSGMVPSARAVLSSFDVLVLSSRTEGTPIILLEAMAAGTPIVATTVGGVPDMLSASDAILVEPENPSAVAEAILSVRTDPESARARAAAARDRLHRQFGMDAWLNGHDVIYRAALSHRAG